MASRVDLGIDKAELFKLIGYEPHSPNQWAIHNSTARFKIPTCGRRWGKSECAGNELTAHMFIPDTRWWICGPTYKLGEKEFRVVFRNLVNKLKLGSKIKKSYNVQQGQMRIQMPWGAVLEVVSAEKQDSLVGEGLDGVVMSEAALHRANTWEMFIEPALTDKRGWALFPSTPRGFNWYHGLWRLGQEGYDDYQSWQLPSWTNPVVYPGGREDPEIKRIESIVSEFHFRQEYGAEFAAFEGKIYSEFDRSIHVTDIEYNPNWENYWVFDFGFTDPFVCLDIMVDPSDNVYVWREYQVTHKATFEHGLALRSRENPPGFHVDAMYGDPRGPDEIATLSMVLGPILARNVPWILGIEAVKRHMKIQPNGKPKFYIDRRCHDAIRQIEMLRMPETLEGRNNRRPTVSKQPERQVDYDDHAADALRYFFNERFVLGSIGNLADVYGRRYQGSESDEFFTYRSSFRNTPGLITYG